MSCRNFLCIGMWIMLVGAIVVPQSLYAQCVPPPSGMVAWWPGDNNTNDIINGNNGTLTGAYGSGKVADAFLLVNAGDCVTVPDDPTLDFGTGDLTIDAWIKTKNAGGPCPLIVGKHTNNPPRGYQMFLSGDGRLCTKLADGASGWFIWYSNPEHLNDDEWHHVTVTVERISMGGKMYVDGQHVYTFDPSTVSGDISNSGSLCIGRVCG